MMDTAREDPALRDFLIMSARYLGVSRKVADTLLPDRSASPCPQQKVGHAVA